MTELPSSWRWSTVAEVGSLGLGRQRHPDWHTGPNMKPYLRVANVFEDRIDTTDVKEMDFTGNFERFKLYPGDVLLNEGQTPELLGRPAVYRGIPADIAFTNSLIRFRAGRDVLPDWALAVFRHYMHSGRFTRESRITTNIAHLSATRFKSIEFPIPPLDEQRRIVELLEDHLSRLDAANELLWQQRARAAGLEALCANHATTNFGGDGVPLADIAEFITDGDHNPPKRIPAGVPHVTAKGIRPDGSIDLNAGTYVTEEGFQQTARRYRPVGGDVIVTCVGTIGRIAVVPEGARFSADRNLAAIRVDVSKAQPEYIALALRATGAQLRMASASGSTAQPHLYLKDLRALTIRVPGLAAQRALVIRASEQLLGVRTLEHEVSRTIRRSGILKRSLLAAAFSGHLTGAASDLSGSDVVEELADG